MKVIDLGHHDPTLDGVIGFAKEELGVFAVSRWICVCPVTSR